MGRENARARALQRTRERAAKNRPLRRREACVATVSNKSSSCAKVGAKANKKIGRARGWGEEKGFLFCPPPPRSFLIFALFPTLSTISRGNACYTQAREKRLPQMLVGYAFLNKARRCNKYTNKLVIFDARSMFATDGNMLKRFVAHLCYGSLKVRWME